MKYATRYNGILENVIVVFNNLNGSILDKGQIYLAVYVLHGMVTTYQPYDYGSRLVLFWRTETSFLS